MILNNLVYSFQIARIPEEEEVLAVNPPNDDYRLVDMSYVVADGNMPIKVPLIALLHCS